MSSRKYTRIVEFWQVVSTEDGYGGNPVTIETLVAKSWANIKTALNNYRYIQKITDLGITDGTNTIILNLRYRNDINYNIVNQYIKYNGYKYVIQSAVNIDLENLEIEIIATKEQTDSITVIDPLNV